MEYVSVVNFGKLKRLFAALRHAWSDSVTVLFLYLYITLAMNWFELIIDIQKLTQIYQH